MYPEFDARKLEGVGFPGILLLPAAMVHEPAMTAAPSPWRFCVAPILRPARALARMRVTPRSI